MIYIKNLLYFTAILVVVALGALLFPTSRAEAGDVCNIEFIKEAIPSGDTDFDFTCVLGQNEECFTSMGPLAEFSLMDGDSLGISIGSNNPPNNVVTVAENVPEGWRLDDISCTLMDTISFDFNVVDNGVLVTCIQPENNASCTFRNIRACDVTIAKNAVPDDGTLFDFTAPGSSDPNFTLQNNEDVELLIDSGLNVDVTELVPDGWILEAIDCAAPDGVVITDIPNGRNFACSPAGGTAECVFINTPIRPIPTLSEWALLAMAGVLGIIGLLAMRRRKAAA